MTAAVKKPFSWSHEVRQWAWLILIVLGIHSFIAKPFFIPSESMVDTLLVGDRLVVSKFPYGFSYMSPSIPLVVQPILPKMQGRIFGSLPRRGDVVVIKSPSDGNDWIKRVIGLPGDTVEMVNGRLILNGKPVPTTRVADSIVVASPNSDCALNGFPQYRTTAADGTGICKYPRFQEVFPDGRRHNVIDLMDGPYDNWGPATVPEGAVFLMGDNRDNSKDSRVPVEEGGLGMVPIENIVGRAEFTTFSLDGSTTLNPLTWWTSLRGDRAFRNLQPD
ncbi:signal peptidase I [Sandaracinobacteroides saxicola]|uniref:Signal peptidase I n=1 Tax=Sandaracinobacteroides saxicola TaxID=2759707 RepID=A0A7G5IEC3_9SPHN|nr:signal peptidase I [Sandaracinobacteroides saxicola]QMW21715.1 signal peptidase I [Sandaracinobacteroides saxicola]